MNNHPTYVTGANGFLGKRLMQKLGGDKIPIPHDVIQQMYVGEYRQFFFLSTCGNLASQQFGPEKVIRANVSDLAHVLECTLRFKLKPDAFVYVSSSSVSLPVQTPYSRTKRAAEEMIQATSLPYCIVRPFSITGVNEQPEHLIPTLIRSCMEGTPMDFVSDATHDFIDVEDVVDGMILLAAGQARGIFELGRGTAYSNLEVLSMVEKATGRTANIKHTKQLRDYDNAEWVCRDFRAREAGWMPQKSLEESIWAMVEAYKSVR